MRKCVVAAGVCACALTLVAGCGPNGYRPQAPARVEPATYDPNDKNALMPLRTGNQWVYAVVLEKYESGKQISAGEGEIIYRVASAKTESGRVTASLQFVQSDKVLDVQEWMADARGVYQNSAQIEGRSVRYSPTAQTIIPLPAEAGKKFLWVGDGPTPAGSTGETRVESEIQALQEVDSDMGRYSTVPVRSMARFTIGSKSGTSESTAWFSPGVGIVRYRQDTIFGSKRTIIVLKLRNYTLKQQ